jgi:hypothetical protein
MSKPFAFRSLLVLCLLVGAAAAVQAQHQVLYLDPKGDGTVVSVEGAILDETKAFVTVKPVAGEKVDIPGKAVVDIIYAPAKAEVAAEFKKAYDAEQAAARTVGIDRRKALNAVIEQYRALLPKLDNEKNIKRHVEFRIAVLTAHAAAGDKARLIGATGLLEKYLKDHPDSWQTIPCEKQLALLKGKK